MTGVEDELMSGKPRSVTGWTAFRTERTYESLACERVLQLHLLPFRTIRRTKLR